MGRRSGVAKVQAIRVGDRVRRTTDGQVGVVFSTQREPFYEVNFIDGAALVHRDELERLPEHPAALLALGQLGEFEHYVVRLQALYLNHAYRYDPLSGLSNARIEPQLHQVYVAHRVTEKLQPRMILADEVGLGKTIEAGLIMKELVARQMISRVLVVCPANLVLQWQHELQSKFNEDFEVMDGAGARFLGKDGTNPWLKRDRIICSIQFAANPANAEKIIEAPWDLVIFDEAHRVRRRRQSAKKVQTTQAYRLADELKELISGLLLLTATPMQLHSYELFSLIELVEPGLFKSFEEYELRRAALPALNQLMKSLQGWDALSDKEQQSVFKKHQALVSPFRADQLPDPAIRIKLMDQLVEKHPLSGVLVRNRKTEVGGFTDRVAHRVTVELTQSELDLYQDVTEYIRGGYNRALATKQMAAGFVMVTYQKMLASSSHALRQSLLRRLKKLKQGFKAQDAKKIPAFRLDELEDAEEMSAALLEAEEALAITVQVQEEIAQLQSLIDRLGQVRDSKALELLKAVREIFKSNPGERLLVFTQFVETQDFLRHALEANQYTVTIFNGQLPADVKEESVRKFRANEAQILISTEAGGEGRNFQFCHVMVNYDLPWNPMKVEQRIGRLDRIGQRKPVFIYNLACLDTIEVRILNVLEERIGLFQESVGALDPILGEVEQNIARLVLEDVKHFDDEFRRYEISLDQQVRQARAKERTLADFVLDRASLRRDIANRLLGESPLARFADLQTYAARSLEFFGGTAKEQEDRSFTISLSPLLATKMLQKSPVIRGVFDPDVAREREELQFLAFGHTLIDQLLNAARSQPEIAFTAARRLSESNDDVAVEIWYEIQGESLKPTGRIIRHLVKRDLQVESQDVRSLPPAGTPIDVQIPGWLAEAMTASKSRFDEEHALEREHISAQEESVKSAEIERAARIFQYRQVRLEKVIASDEQWIKDKESNGTERERRILPARRGKVAKDKARLAQLTSEHQLQAQKIKARRAGTRAIILAAGLVVGEK